MNLYQATRCFKRDSLFGIGNGLTPGRPNNRHSIPSRDRRGLSLSNFPDRLWSSPNLLFRGHGVSKSVKRRRRETDHSPLSSAKTEKTGAIASSLSYDVIACTGTVSILPLSRT
jgi:hypothetical protein